MQSAFRARDRKAVRWRRSVPDQASTIASHSVLQRSHTSMQASMSSRSRQLVMQASHILDTNPNADAETIKRGIEGNLCRCTGYKKIVDAVESACCGGR